MKLSQFTCAEIPLPDIQVEQVYGTRFINVMDKTSEFKSKIEKFKGDMDNNSLNENETTIKEPLCFTKSMRPKNQ